MKTWLLFILFIVGCRNNNEKYINSYKIPKTEIINIVSNQQSVIPFSWDAPVDWIPNNNSSGMRTASYLIPCPKGSADLSITHFPGDAGGATANVNRWRKQLGLQELAYSEINLLAEKMKSTIGPCQIYKIVNPKNKQSAFLCSIIPADDFTIFIKLDTYPDIIDELYEDFIRFSSSFKYNE